MKILLFVFILLMATPIFSQQPPLETGVSLNLAKWRSANYSDIRYKLNITLEKGAPLMKGNIEIRVNLTEEGAKNDLILDWRTTQFQNDKDKPYAHVTSLNGQTPLVIEAAEHLRISRDNLKTGENVIEIEFASPIKTSGSAITRYIDKEDGGEYIYSLFVPSDASTAFPVFDQPDLKARFRLTIFAPNEWKAISNERTKFVITKTEETTRGGKDSTGYEFQETKPISTYVFAFAAGDFADFADTKAPVKMTERKKEPNESMITMKGSTDNSDTVVTIDKVPPRIYVRKSQAEKFKPHAEEVFRLNREAIKFYENYFDYKFPFPKYDFVLIPEFPFGGMEHAGATFLRESSVIFPTEPTKNDYVSRVNLIFHETAHQWFGDLVTMKWFDDLWLKEGFATFMGYKAMEKIMPEYNAWKIFYERTKQTAYLTDSTKGTTPIYQEIPNLSAAKSAYGNIVYNKAPAFLRQAEFYLGEKEFQTAIRAFLKKHQFANATWQDLVTEFETASKQDLKDWANVWVKKRGMPVARMVRVESAKSKGYLVNQKDSFNEHTWWKFKFKVFVIENNNRSKSEIIETIQDREGVLGYDGTTDTSSKLIFPNYQDYGYGIFLLDDKSRDYVLKNIQNEKDDFLRTMMWGSLWDSVRESELAPKDYVELVIKNFALSPAFTRQTPEQNSSENITRNANRKPPEGGTQNYLETDESTISTLLGRVSTAMNYYLSDSQRAELAPKLETVLIDKLQNAPTLGQRITFYRSFLNIASSENARTILKEILNGKFDEKGRSPRVSKGAPVEQSTPLLTRGFLPLKTKDKFDIITKLMILNDKDAPNLLADLEKLETSDEAKRYAYAAKAGIATAENKAKYWNDFVNNKEISESYIESAFAVWNSSKHAELTLPYLEKALAELPNLKKNRKIFFVNGWLGSFIGGQKSEQALAIVNKFLADNPNLDKDLRLKILENVDGLERAVKIRAKYGK